MRRVRDLSPYIGQKIKAKILELDKNRNNVVLSRRQYLEETQSEVRETFLSQLKKGQIREGRRVLHRQLRRVRRSRRR
jgi:small subunit ribosomal protein S1